MAQTYADSPIKDEDGYNDSLNLVRHYLRPEYSIIEVACGTGTTALRLAAYVDNILATDFSENLIDIAKQRQREADPSPSNVTFLLSDANNPPGESASYDGAIIMNTLHLLSHPQETIDVLVDKIKPGGLFVSKTHCLSGKRVLRMIMSVIQFLGIAPHLNYFTVENVTKLHTDASLEILETKEYDSGERCLIIARKPK